MNDMRINKVKLNEADWLIDKISEASKNTRRIHSLYIGLLFYCFLTVLTVTNMQLVFNETVRLPIFNLDVPLNGFFFISPIMVLILFIYFQIHLNELKQLTNTLELKYPNDKKRIYPWIMNLSDNHPSEIINKIKNFIISFSLWWALPLFLCTNAFQFVKKHAKIWNIIVVFLIPIIGIIFVLLFWEFYNHRDCNFKVKEFINRLKRDGIIYLLILFIIIEIFLLFSIHFSFKGIKIIKSWPCVDLSYQKLIIEKNEDYKTLYWIDLKNIHLEGANLSGSILKRADLQNAYLKNAILQYTDLREARLDNADLQNSDLWSAQLENATLKNTKLDGAKFWKANLKNARFDNASLKKTEFNGAQLNGADFKNAITNNVDFRIVYIDSTKFVGTNLDSASYVSKSLYDMFQGIDSFEANFKNKKLIRTDLRGVKNLTVEQLKVVKSPQMAILDSSEIEKILKMQFSNVDSAVIIDQF